MPWFFPSFLTPTFLILGVLAISLPILFHFFRRTPKGNVQFSTLMFLQPSPPRLTKRSRVDNWLLLILRGLVLLFIALAFGRIFFRQTDFLNISDLPSRRVAILVDSSASMFRDGLWDQAKQEFKKVIDGLGPNDDVGVYTFDQELKAVAGFSSGSSSDSEARIALIRNSLDSLSPNWRTTDLGTVLIDAVDELQIDAESDSADQISDSQIILITDLQAGSNLRALQFFEWPKRIPIEVKAVGEEQSDNATLSLMDQSKGISPDSKIRVKVTNVEDASSTQFELHWIASDENEETLAGTLVVPPGQSRVIHLSPPDFEFSGLELTGDGDAFDNRFYLAYPRMVPQRILFVGDDEDSRNQLYFYLKKACSSLIGKRFEFLDSFEFDEEAFSTDGPPAIVFVAGKISDEASAKIRKFNEQGGLVCAIVTDINMQPVVERLVGEKVTIESATQEDYSLLVDIDFGHKMFAKFADPKFSNFSNIRFWKHRRVSSKQLKTIAAFDNGNLAIGTKAIGDGEFYLFASGWHPADSQFALSTKFVGVMMSMMLKKLVRENRNYRLDEPIAISDFLTGDKISMVKPDGNSIELTEVSKPSVLPDADVPGIYDFSSSAQTKQLAFNLPASESRTTRLSADLLEQEGVELGTMTTATEEVEKERQRKDKELESRQKLWRWMLILAMVVLVLETMLSSFFVGSSKEADVSVQES